MARRTKEEAEQTRKDILQAALDMFCEKGYTRTTFEDIAKSINLTKGAIYWYFRNKPDVLKALMLGDFQNTSAKLESLISKPQNLDELKQYFMIIAKMVDNDANFRKFLCFLMFQMEWSSGLLNSFKDIFEQFRSKPITMITDALTCMQNSGQIVSDIDVEELTCTIFAMWNGLLIAKLGRQEKVKLAEMLDYSFDFVIKALESRKE